VLAHVFGHVYGTLLLHVIAYYVAVFSIYSIVKSCRDERTGFATACLLGCHPLFIGANGWDYLDGGSIAYLSVAIVALTKAARSERPRTFVALAGMVWLALGRDLLVLDHIHSVVPDLLFVHSLPWEKPPITA
jgi:4-amino-4-deoxy-L-arabinose transferase-like glycosyltransferase